MRQPLEVMGRMKDMRQRETVSDQRIEQPGAHKEALSVNVEPLTYICNTFFEGCFPDSMKITRIVPIFKAGD